MNEETTAQAPESLGIHQILELLPHRYPLLLIDRVIDIRGDESGVGIKNVTFNEPQFQGHFPENPVFPGVLLVEAMAQTAGVIAARTQPRDAARKVFFTTIDKAKFRRPVIPGDRVEFHMTKKASKRAIYWYSGRALVDGALVCEAELSVMIGG
ncbi:3-hydroxyacyl-ACP dehydratase FabZ [Methylosinus sp. H3A]|uniref:3-hydroxyacyl-ACP dehydratase FabZ n=1 Tax=Methylosinus sp. H3A TaxID=2785786 RepID=UPI0018C25F6D|nr:3-hydroxyacyl-ACP dehydratase FabZ [Methylosinus sp. H3A]MBG0811465.1 3-hydroxyacyl-ACP dehydratase FabZ [Methylosinus sp. H3A]